MLQILKKLKLYTKLCRETVYKYVFLSKLFVIICRLLAPTKVFLQLEYHIELLLHL